jgi:hypothetical protein
MNRILSRPFKAILLDITDEVKKDEPFDLSEGIQSRLAQLSGEGLVVAFYIGNLGVESQPEQRAVNVINYLKTKFRDGQLNNFFIFFNGGLAAYRFQEGAAIRINPYLLGFNNVQLEVDAVIQEDKPFRRSLFKVLPFLKEKIGLSDAEILLIGPAPQFFEIWPGEELIDVNRVSTGLREAVPDENRLGSTDAAFAKTGAEATELVLSRVYTASSLGHKGLVTSAEKRGGRILQETFRLIDVSNAALFTVMPRIAAALQDYPGKAEFVLIRGDIRFTAKYSRELMDKPLEEGSLLRLEIEETGDPAAARAMLERVTEILTSGAFAQVVSRAGSLGASAGQVIKRGASATTLETPPVSAGFRITSGLVSSPPQFLAIRLEDFKAMSAADKTALRTLLALGSVRRVVIYELAPSELASLDPGMASEKGVVLCAGDLTKAHEMLKGQIGPKAHILKLQFAPFAQDDRRLLSSQARSRFRFFLNTGAAEAVLYELHDGRLAGFKEENGFITALHSFAEQVQGALRASFAVATAA